MPLSVMAPSLSPLSGSQMLQSHVSPTLAFAEPKATRDEPPVTTPSDLLRPGVNPLPFQPYNTPLCEKTDWQLVVELLPERDPASEYYTLRDIAPCLGEVTTSQLSDHAKSLFPNYEGYYKLNFTQAVRLVRRYILAGRKKFGRETWEAMWRAKYPSLAPKLS